MVRFYIRALPDLFKSKNDSKFLFPQIFSPKSKVLFLTQDCHASPLFKAFAASFLSIFMLIGTPLSPLLASPPQISSKKPSNAQFLFGNWDGQTYLVGVEITAGIGAKTYWRTPGYAGLPTLFSWNGSTNIRSIEVFWPTPTKFKDDVPGERLITYGYSTRVTLPIRITPQNKEVPVRLQLSLDYGLCKEQCIPGDAQFEETLTPEKAPDAVHLAALNQALQEVPIKKPLGDSVGLSIVRIEQKPHKGSLDEMALWVTVRAPLTEQPELFLDIPQDLSFTDPYPEKHENKDYTLFKFLIGSKEPFKDAPIRLVLVSENQAIEVETKLTNDRTMKPLPDTLKE